MPLFPNKYRNQSAKGRRDEFSPPESALRRFLGWFEVHHFLYPTLFHLEILIIGYFDVFGKSRIFINPLIRRLLG